MDFHYRCSCYLYRLITCSSVRPFSAVSTRIEVRTWKNRWKAVMSEACRLPVIRHCLCSTELWPWGFNTVFYRFIAEIFECKLQFFDFCNSTWTMKTRNRKKHQFFSEIRFCKLSKYELTLVTSSLTLSFAALKLECSSRNWSRLSRRE